MNYYKDSVRSRELDMSNEAKSNAEKPKEFKVLNLLTMEWFSGNLEELCQQLNVEGTENFSKSALFSLLSKKVKVAGTYALTDFETTLYHAGGEILSGKVSELIKNPPIARNDVVLVINDPNKVIEGYASSKSAIDALNDVSDKNNSPTYTILNLETKDVLDGTADYLSDKTGISRASLSNLLNGKTRIVKSYALDDFDVVVYYFKGDVFEGKVSDISAKIDFDYLTMARLIQNPHLVIRGYSISKESLAKECRENIKYMRHTLYNVDGSVSEGYQDEVAKETGLSEGYVRKLILGTVDITKGWVANKDVLKEYVSENLFTMYKEVDGKIKSVQGTKADLSKKTGLSSYLINKLSTDYEMSSNGWSYSKDTAKNINPDKVLEKAKVFNRSRVITLTSDPDGKETVKGTIDELIFELGVSDPVFKRAIFGSASKIRSQKKAKSFVITHIEPDPDEVSEVD